MRSHYRREMVLVVGLKILALVLIWNLFFSKPVDKSLTRDELAEHYLVGK